MSSPTILVPLPLSYVPDESLSEGRLLIPLSLNFGDSNNILDPTGQFYTNTKSVQTNAVQSTRVISAIKGCAIKYNTWQNDVLVIKCQETGAEWILGIESVAPSATPLNYTINARIPLYVPQGATLVFTNYAPSTNNNITDTAVLQLTNFEIRPIVEVVCNAFGNI